MTDFKPRQVLVIKNRSATNYKRAQKYITQLRALHSNCTFDILDLTDYNSNKTFSLIEDALRSVNHSTLVAVAGGDGTLSSVVNVLCLSPKLSVENKNCVVMPLWGGNANDLAVMLNGSPPKSIESVMKDAKVLNIKPIKVVMAAESSAAVSRTAVCYVSFGASAEILKRMERSSHDRERGLLKSPIVRFAVEVVDILKTVFHLKPVKVRTQRQRLSVMYDSVFLNGPRFAKVLRSPARLDKGEYYEIVVHQKGLRYISGIFRSALRGDSGTMLREKKQFIIRDATVAQIDGELISVQPHTKVTLSTGSVGFAAMSKVKESEV